MGIEERVFSVELHLCMKGYCWLESRAKIAAIVETMQLVLRKNALQINEYECLPNFELKFKVLENLRKPLTLKSMKTHWHWLWKGFQCFRTGTAHKNRKTFGSAQVALRWRTWNGQSLVLNTNRWCMGSRYHQKRYYKKNYKSEITSAFDAVTLIYII